MSRLLLFSILVLAACGNKKVITEQQPDPSATSFWYHDANFRLEEQESPLRTDGLYFRILKADAFGDIYRMFRFFPDGLVIAYVVYNTPDKIAEQVRDKRGNIHGYYQTQQDSVLFTTKVYYNHSPIFYKGQVFADSLILHSRNYKTKEESNFTYYFYQTGDELLIRR